MVLLAKISGTKIDSKPTTSYEASMSSSNVIRFGEVPATMTYAEGLAFVERSRRQLARFEVAIPRPGGETIAPEDAATIHRLLDELEAGFRKDLGLI
jgi:hypothetical protein